MTTTCSTTLPLFCLLALVIIQKAFERIVCTAFFQLANIVKINVTLSAKPIDITNVTLDAVQLRERERVIYSQHNIPEYDQSGWGVVGRGGAVYIP